MKKKERGKAQPLRLPAVFVDRTSKNVHVESSNVAEDMMVARSVERLVEDQWSKTLLKA